MIMGITIDNANFIRLKVSFLNASNEDERPKENPT